MGFFKKIRNKICINNRLRPIDRSTNNYVEFCDLIKIYKNIKLIDIERVGRTCKITDIMSILTGFGNDDTCILCQGASGDCEKCLWNIVTGEECAKGIQSNTYVMLGIPVSNESLHIDIARRILIMEKVVRDYRTHRFRQLIGWI